MTSSIIVLLVLYFTPAFIAFVRGHASKWAILIANILVGWTLIGWVWVLIWSLANKGATQNVYINNVVSQNSKDN